MARKFRTVQNSWVDELHDQNLKKTRKCQKKDWRYFFGVFRTGDYFLVFLGRAIRFLGRQIFGLKTGRATPKYRPSFYTVGGVIEKK